ncbi:MAG: hypothetical protein R3A46_21970, partial [Thermomicrobiales bacterium]
MISATHSSHHIEDEPVYCPMLDAEAARTLLEARENGRAKATASLDLGRTSSVVELDESGARMPGELLLGWQEVEEIAESGERCYAVQDDGSVWPVGVFSETTGWYRSLIRTGGTP